MSRYMVTGCAGFIGSHLVDRLLARGDAVVGVDAFTDYYPRQLKRRNLAGARRHPGFSLLEADLSQDRPAPVGGLDGVFHLAAQPGVRDSWGESFAVYVRDNIVATQRLFEAATGARVRVVFASSSSVYGDAATYPTPEHALPCPVSPYGVTKLSCEHLAGAYTASAGLDIVCLRYFSVYGPRQRPDMAFARIVSALLESRPFRLLGSGDQVRDFTYVDDVVAASIMAMEQARGGSVYNVGGGTPCSLMEAIELCERLTGCTLALDRRRPARGDPARTVADTTRIGAELGWEPRTSLADGLAAQVAAGTPPRRVLEVVGGDGRLPRESAER
ncbi:MAG: NAD-dependent epimerase/dehydratase family protein [Solirubrobacteraceae bacterium]